MTPNVTHCSHCPLKLTGAQAAPTRIEMIDLTTWNLSIPVGVPATTIDTPALAAGFQDQYFKSGNTLFFWAPVTGTKTVSAKFPRTELRETHADGSVNNWNYGSADNILRAAVAVNQVPSSGKIVIGQIHCYESTEPLLKVEYQYHDQNKLGNIVAKLRPTPTQEEPTVITIAEGVPMNQRFTYTIHLSPTGMLTVNAFDHQWSTKIGTEWASKGLYFKAGVYTQDNTGYTTEGGAATFYKLAITHEKKA